MKPCSKPGTFLPWPLCCHLSSLHLVVCCFPTPQVPCGCVTASHICWLEPNLKPIARSSFLCWATSEMQSPCLKKNLAEVNASELSCHGQICNHSDSPRWGWRHDPVFWSTCRRLGFSFSIYKAAHTIYESNSRGLWWPLLTSMHVVVTHPYISQNTNINEVKFNSQ